MTIFLSALHADSVLHINYNYKLVYIPMLFAIIKTRFRKLEEHFKKLNITTHFCFYIIIQHTVVLFLDAVVLYRSTGESWSYTLCLKSFADFAVHMWLMMKNFSQIEGNGQHFSHMKLCSKALSVNCSITENYNHVLNTYSSFP